MTPSRALSNIMLLLISAVGHAQTTGTDSTFRLLTYGLPRFEYQNAEAVVGEKWGIQNYVVAGCIVSRELEDSVKKVNDQVTALIVARYGADWEQRFEADVERELAREKEVILKVRALPYIQAKQKELETQGNGLNYWVIPDRDGDDIVVQGYAPWDGEVQWLTLYTFRADASNGSISLVSDVPRKE